jgi:hypothetical protein
LTIDETGDNLESHHRSSGRLLVMGCQQRMLINPNATPEQARRDTQECDYQAELATATMRNELERAFRRGNLRESCMKLRG